MIHSHLLYILCKCDMIDDFIYLFVSIGPALLVDVPRDKNITGM